MRMDHHHHHHHHQDKHYKIYTHASLFYIQSNTSHFFVFPNFVFFVILPVYHFESFPIPFFFLHTLFNIDKLNIRI